MVFCYRTTNGLSLKLVTELLNVAVTHKSMEVSWNGAMGRSWDSFAVKIGEKPTLLSEGLRATLMRSCVNLRDYLSTYD